MGHAELGAPFGLGVVQVHADDLVGADHAGALDHVQTDAAQAEDDDVRPGGHLGGVGHRAHAGGHAAAAVAGLVEGRVLTDLRHGDFRQDDEVREGRAAHVVVDRLALVGHARGAVGHHALALRGADRGAQVGLARQAGFTLAALGGVQRDDVIVLLDRFHARTHGADDACALVAQHRGEDPFAVQPVQGVGVGMADAGRHDLDQNLALLRAFQVDLDDFQRFLRLEGDGCTGFHGGSLRNGDAFTNHRTAGRGRAENGLSGAETDILAPFRDSAALRRDGASETGAPVGRVAQVFDRYALSGDRSEQGKGAAPGLPPGRPARGPAAPHEGSTLGPFPARFATFVSVRRRGWPRALTRRGGGGEAIGISQIDISSGF